MPPATYKVAEARARFSELLTRARAGEEIVITKDREPHARHHGAAIETADTDFELLESID